MEINGLSGFSALTKVEGLNSAKAASGVSPLQSFSNLVEKSIDDVSKAQSASADAKERLQSGDDSVSIHDAMLSMQKASLAFQSMTAVRSKVVGAYNQIMQMNI